MMKLPTAIFLAALAGATSHAIAQEQGDAEAGAKVFKKCAACHAIGENAKNKVGPVLNGVIGRPAGSYEGYKYSAAMQAKAASGLVWDEAKIFDYLPDPSAYLGDRSKMTFKLVKEDQRRDVIAYLRQFAADGSKAP